MAGSLMAALLWCLAPHATDGDTLTCGDSVTHVRIFGVNAAEKGQPGWEQARDALQKHIDGGITCQPKGTSYDRIVGLCYQPDGADVGHELLTVDQTVKEACTFSDNYYGTCPK
jgi:endonuclease YncB( thermonuclease family)